MHSIERARTSKRGTEKNEEREERRRHNSGSDGGFVGVDWSAGATPQARRGSTRWDAGVHGQDCILDGERSEDARRVAGRAATTGRVDGEIQEELKRPSDCWYVPVCRVLGDSKEDA